MVRGPRSFDLRRRVRQAVSWCCCQANLPPILRFPVLHMRDSRFGALTPQNYSYPTGRSKIIVFCVNCVKEIVICHRKNVGYVHVLVMRPILTSYISYWRIRSDLFSDTLQRVRTLMQLSVNVCMLNSEPELLVHSESIHFESWT